jgi:hypothetical protein
VPNHQLVVEAKVIGYQKQQLQNLAQVFQSGSQMLMDIEGTALLEVRKLDLGDGQPLQPTHLQVDQVEVHQLLAVVQIRAYRVNCDLVIRCRNSESFYHRLIRSHF